MTEQLQGARRGTSIDEIREILSKTLPGWVLERSHSTYFCKTILFLSNDAGERCVGKLATHPYSQTLIAQETQGYAFARRYQEHFQLPDHTIAIQSPKYTLAITDYIEGKPFHPLSRCPRSFIMLEDQIEEIVLTSYIETNPRLAQPELSKAIERMTIRFTNHFVPIGPSHGDFIYWNLLKMQEGRIGLIDFEYFSPCRAAYFDQWHWLLFPLCRKLQKLRSITAFKQLIQYLADHPPKWLKGNPNFTQKQCLEFNRMLLCLYLLEQAGLILTEHTLNDIEMLIGNDAYTSRQLIAKAYLEACENLL